MTGEHRIVVLGAGYAGLSAAQKMARTKGVRVTMIDSRTEFVDRVRLHQVVAGQDVARWDLRERLARKGIDFVQGRASSIDTAAKQVCLDGGTTVAYDSLVYALGSFADTTGAPGVAEYAHSPATPEDVRRIPALTGRVAVVGGGPTGIELATELAESRPDLTVQLISADEPGAWLSDKARTHIGAVLARLGVRVHSGAKVAEVTATGVNLVDGTHLPAETVLWTTGFAVSDVAARSGLEVDGRGRVLVDDELRSRSHPEIYAVGDCAVMPGPDGRELRMACATAMPAGKYVATALTTRIQGKQPEPFTFGYHLQCLSLGRRDACVQFVNPDDTMAARVLTGRSGKFVKELILRVVGSTSRP